MNKKINVWTAITLCVIVSVITYIFASSTLRNSYNEKIDDAYASLAPFNKLFEIDNYVKKNFVGTVDQENVIKGLLYGYFAGLGDPFSTYHTKEEMEEMNMANNGKLVGIGVLISKEYEHSYSYIRRVMPGSPAENAGLKNGDIITEINGIKLNDE
ncbi:MAG: PDZ domain-containing protein, partial [Clostridia bacterium]